MAPAIDHVTLAVHDFATARRFYGRVLSPLGLGAALDWPTGSRAHFALPGEPSALWLAGETNANGARLALAAADRSAVLAFHRAALAAGGTSLDAPRVRDEHTSRTFAASVADPEGNVVEAFCWGLR